MAQQRGDGARRTAPRDALGESELVVALFRTLLAGVVLMAPAASRGGAQTVGFYLTVGAVGTYCFLATLLLYRRIHWRFQRHVMLVVDILCLTALIANQGGIRGGLFPLYYLTMVVGAMWFSLPGAIGAAALSAVMLAVAMSRTETPERLFYLLRYHFVPQVLLLFLAAFLCAYLAEAWHAEQRRAEQQEQIMAQFSKQISWAHELQTLVLPARLAAVPGVEIGVRTRQADLVVGGDYYDALAFPDGTLGLCCADVSGKSVPGQLRLPLVKFAFRVCANQFREPRRAVEELNQILCQELPPGMFVSLAYTLINPAAGRLEIAGKHCPPLHLIAETGQIEVVELSGVVLGAEPGIQYPPVNLPFALDDYLVFYTDGVIEAKDRRGRELDVGGLVELVREATPESAQDLANVLFQALEGYEVGAKHDDLTLLVVRRTNA